MLREVVNINEELCDGCGDCVPACHEGALQIIDGKARLISDLLCDGLGACLGHCPQEAITIEKREAEPYDEVKVIQLIIPKGKNTVLAHLKHLRDHQEFDFMKQAMQYMQANRNSLPFNLDEIVREMHKPKVGVMHGHQGGGCPGSAERAIQKPTPDAPSAAISGASELRQWPVQMHLINPASPMFAGSDMVLAADCAAFAMGDFHNRVLKGKTVGIACPKLDQGTESYMQKLIRLIDEAKINTLSVVIMEVPCCSGLLQMAKMAVSQASRKIPLKMMKISIAGEVLMEEWV
ncbi:ATP-binding protein [Natronoflexus pectinivorans]|uniref:4Fe-4S binding protein n=1 Tax=Natronoflexus pectinivorans TaxID=682526 RepID=A0A4R2GD84_9BACT|nr:4Fe-4S binding protein [Natronoflexus pectinivorans]TCO05996.1 4Fe-4S binding protein [Natronoflexus pectinivorans]